ncbi:MAG: hypothetical protein ACP5IT_10745 [Thermoproteota archaeon]
MDEFSKRLNKYVRILRKNPNAYIAEVIESKNPFIVFYYRDSDFIPLLYFGESEFDLKVINYKKFKFQIIRFRGVRKGNVEFLRQLIDADRQRRTKKVKRTNIGTWW